MFDFNCRISTLLVPTVQGWQARGDSAAALQEAT
jgi:hypothetical protein